MDLQRKFGFVLVVLLCAIWCVPFLNPFHIGPHGSFASEWIAVLLLLCLATVIALEDSRDPTGEGSAAPTIVLLPGVMLLMLALQIALGKFTYVQQFIWPACYALCMALAAWVGFRLRARLGVRILEHICLSLCAAGVATTAVLALQFAQLDYLATPIALAREPATRPYGNFGQPNHAALFLALGLAGACYLYSIARIGTKRLVLFSFVLVLGLALTGSRMGVIFTTALALFGWLYFPRMAAVERPKGWQFITLMPLLFLGMSLVVKLVAATFSLEYLTSYERGAHDGIRLKLWQDAWTIFFSHPLVGVGFGEFTAHQYGLVDRWDSDVLSRHAHNLPLQLLAETGLLGAVGVFVPLLLWVLRAKIWQAGKVNFFAVTAFSSIAVHSCLEYPLWYTYFLIPAAMLLGVLETNTFRSKPKAPKALVWSSLAALWIACALVVVEYATVIETTASAFSARPPFEKAATLQKGQHSFFFRPESDFALARLLAPSPDRLDQLITVHERLLHYFADPGVIRRYALLLSRRQRNDEAIVHIERSRKLFPQDFSAALRKMLESGQSEGGELSVLAMRLQQKYPQLLAADGVAKFPQQ
jgi:O-antigen ligase